MFPRLLTALALLIPLAPVPAQVTRAEYAARRTAVAARMGEGVLLALGADEPVEDYLSFYQTPDFRYLTGLLEPGAALVMVKRGGRLSSTMFVETKDPAREVWSGRRLGPDSVARLTGMPARPDAALRPALDSLAAAGLPLYVLASAAEQRRSAQLVAHLRRTHPGLRVASAAPWVATLRGKKSPGELDLLRKAADITSDAEREAMGLIEPGLSEFEVQALIEYTFRRDGAERPGFATIVGSGPNSTTLHYNANDRAMGAGDLVVMDVGAAYRGYSADVTRTVPVSGTFTADQRALYQLVRDAQAAAERQAKLGAPPSRMIDSANAVLAAGLARLGLIESPTATYDCGEGGAGGCAQMELYYMHALGHDIGLEVHDAGDFFSGAAVAPGSAFTLEPGVYVRGNLLELVPKTARNQSMVEKIRPAVERFRDMGVRIEDDYVVTDAGVQRISLAPREIAEIEALMRAPYAGPAKRDSTKVGWYTKTGTRD